MRKRKRCQKNIVTLQTNHLDPKKTRKIRKDEEKKISSLKKST
jgi:hypothetical protein